MISKNLPAALGLFLVAQHSMAGVVASVVGVPTGGALPLGIGGITGIATVSLIIGVQLIKRRTRK